MWKNRLRVWRRTLLTLFSVGWLLPLWWVGDSIVSMAEFKAAPHLFPHPPAPFFFIHAGREVFAFALLWLATVLAAWIAILSRR